MRLIGDVVECDLKMFSRCSFYPNHDHQQHHQHHCLSSRFIILLSLTSSYPGFSSFLIFLPSHSNSNNFVQQLVITVTAHITIYPTVLLLVHSLILVIMRSTLCPMNRMSFTANGIQGIGRGEPQVETERRKFHLSPSLTAADECPTSDSEKERGKQSGDDVTLWVLLQGRGKRGSSEGGAVSGPIVSRSWIILIHFLPLSVGLFPSPFLSFPWIVPSRRQTSLCLPLRKIGSFLQVGCLKSSHCNQKSSFHDWQFQQHDRVVDPFLIPATNLLSSYIFIHSTSFLPQVLSTSSSRVMDLWCDESTVQVMNEEGEVEADCLEAFPDENILQDDRVLERLLLSESRCLPSDPCQVFTMVQTELLPGMRKVLTNWMLEVRYS